MISVIVSFTTSCMGSGSQRARARSVSAPMSAPLSSGFGRSSATSTPALRISRTIRGSAIAGATRMELSFRERLDTWTQALAIKIILLAAVFLVVPIIFYRLFQIADAQQTELLARTVEQKGTLIA